MAWWSLYKWFIQFRTKPYTNYIRWYNQKLFNEWYAGLSENEKVAYKKECEKWRETAHKDMDSLMMMYGGIMAPLIVRCSKWL